MIARHLPRTLPIALMLAFGLTLPSVGPVAASCVPLQMQLPDAATPDTLVFVGTVSGLDPIRTELAVNGWFLGPDPTDIVVVLGGRDPNLITSADWTPGVGEQYAVIATRTPEGSLLTDICKQGLLTTDLLAVLQATYGDPQLPPFPMPSPSTSPGSSPSSSPGPSASPAASISPSVSPSATSVP